MKRICSFWNLESGEERLGLIVTYAFSFVNANQERKI